MSFVLVVNPYALLPDGLVAQEFEAACQLLNGFFKTWQEAVGSNICEKYIACETDIWTWTPAASKTMHDYLRSLRRDQLALVHQLLKITIKTPLEHFGDDILAIATRLRVYIDQKREVPVIGCACISDNTILLSLRTDEAWENEVVSVYWEGFGDEESPPRSRCPNFSDITHVEKFRADLEAQRPITKEKFKAALPSVEPSEKFWRWFEKLNHDVQMQIMKKAGFCADSHWETRQGTPFTSLRGTNHALAELRCWPMGKTLRIYAKRESPERVVFLCGSDKDGQVEAIEQADDYYGEMKR